MLTAGLIVQGITLIVLCVISMQLAYRAREKRVYTRRKHTVTPKVVVVKKKVIVKKKFVRNAWQRRRMSEGVKRYWAKMTPERRKVELDKRMRRRLLTKQLADMQPANSAVSAVSTGSKEQNTNT